MVLFAACRKTNDGSSTLPNQEYSRLRGHAGAPPSLAHFTDAEQKLVLGEYSFAAAQLNKGIIAYRSETGKMNGNAARQANRAIDGLIVVRKKLREGKAVSTAELHLAIQNALAVEGAVILTPPEPREKPSLGVPVGGH